MIDDAGRELSAASAPVVRGDREDHFLRVRQVPDAAGHEGLAHGERVQGLPQQLDPSVLGHETASKQVMDSAPGRRDRRVRHVFGEHLLWGVDQNVGVLGLEGEVEIEPGERVLEFADRLATAVAPGGECPRWRRFLAEITDDDEELQRYLQRMAGYCLTGVTTEHALFFGWGTGALSLDAIYKWEKDAVNLSLAGVPTNANGLPIAPYLPQTLTATISNNQSVMLASKYRVGPLQVYAGYQWYQLAPPSDPVNTVTGFTNIGGLPMGSAYGNMTAVTNLAYSAGCAARTTCSDKVMQVMWTGAKYAVTQTLDVIGAYYHYIQNDYTSASCTNPAAHSQCAGTFDAVSAVVDWRFAPKWDTYFGMMFSQVNAGLSNGYLARNNFDPTAGVRFRF